MLSKQTTLVLKVTVRLRNMPDRPGRHQGPAHRRRSSPHTARQDPGRQDLQLPPPLPAPTRHRLHHGPCPRKPSRNAWRSSRPRHSGRAASATSWSRPRGRRRSATPLLDSPAALAAWMLDHDTDAYHKITRAFVDGQPSGGAHPGPHPRQHHAVLADRHRGLGGPVVLGERTSPGRSTIAAHNYGTRVQGGLPRISRTSVRARLPRPWRPGRRKRQAAQLRQRSRRKRAGRRLCPRAISARWRASR